MSSSDEVSIEDLPDIVAQRQGGNTDHSQWHEECETVLSVLEAAEEPLAVSEVAMLAFLGETAARNRLNDLRERGRVERLRGPGDRRTVRYAPADGAGEETDG